MRTFHRDGYDAALSHRMWRHFVEQVSVLSESDGLQNTRMHSMLHLAAPYFWRHTELHHRPLPEMIQFAESLVEIDSSAASTWARCGLQTIARHRHGHTYYKSETDIPQLKSIRGKAALSMGLIEVPVPATDPAYPIYKSQAEFAVGNEDSALEL